MGSMASSNKTPSPKSYSRRAYHAGSWYSDAQNELDQTLQGYLDQVEDLSMITGTADGDPSSSTSSIGALRAIICPHAGFSYSGPTAAWSYKALSYELQRPTTPIQTILVLHPSHHVYLDGCAVSGASAIETPLGTLDVDDSLRREILALNDNNPKSKFTIMKQEVDEREHSGEMQYPFIQKCLNHRSSLATGSRAIRILPIMCGALSTTLEERYGTILAPIIRRPEVICVISTDFCHWGSRFQYQPTPSSSTSSTQQIFEFIQEMDHEGMEQIQLQEPGAFAKYLKQTKNTICGRHAIGVWLNAIHCNKAEKDEHLNVSFVRYAQSSSVRSMRDSSVSYASAVARQKV